LAVANIGALLANWGRARGERVLLVDWDLEAPGLHAFFAEAMMPSQRDAPGILEYFEELRGKLVDEPRHYEEIRENRRRIEEVLPLESYLRVDVLQGLDLMLSNPVSPEYRRRATEFDWATFWQNYPAAIHAFRESLERRYRYVLVDSRTGYSDVSGLCSAILPEKLVIVFSLNQQNLEGAIEVARRSVAFRERSDDIRPLAIYPLASRVDVSAEIKERETWLRQFEDAFEACFREIYREPECRLGDYFKNVFIPYVAYFSYGEKLVLLVEDISRTGGLRRACEDFARLLVKSEYPWQPESEWTVDPAK